MLLLYSLKHPEAQQSRCMHHTACNALVPTSSSRSMHVSQHFCLSVQVGDAVTFVWTGNHDVWRVPEAACPPVRCCAALYLAGLAAAAHRGAPHDSDWSYAQSAALHC